MAQVRGAQAGSEVARVAPGLLAVDHQAACCFPPRTEPGWTVNAKRVERIWRRDRGGSTSSLCLPERSARPRARSKPSSFQSSCRAKTSPKLHAASEDGSLTRQSRGSGTDVDLPTAKSLTVMQSLLNPRRHRRQEEKLLQRAARRTASRLRLPTRPRRQAPVQPKLPDTAVLARGLQRDVASCRHGKVVPELGKARLQFHTPPENDRF